MQKGILCKTPFCLMTNVKTCSTVIKYTNLTKNHMFRRTLPQDERPPSSASYFFTAPNHFAYNLSYSPFFFRSSKALLISLVSGLFFFREMP